MTHDLWKGLSNLKHLEICDFPYLPKCHCHVDIRCDCNMNDFLNLVRRHSDFIINDRILYKLTSLETLILGHRFNDTLFDDCLPVSLSINFDKFPKLLKFRDYRRDNELCEEIFERDANDKLEGRGKLSWPNGCFFKLRDDLLDRYRYEGEIYINDEAYYGKPEMNGHGVLYYLEGNKYNAERFEGEFKDDYEDEGVIYFLNGDRYEGKLEISEQTALAQGIIYKGVGKIIFQNGDVYSGETRDFKMYGKGILSKKNGSQVEGIFKNNALT